MTGREPPLPKLSKSSLPQVLVFMPCRSCVDDWKNCLVALFGWKCVLNWSKGLKLRCAFLFSNAESRQRRSGRSQNLRGELPGRRLPTSLVLEAMVPETRFTLEPVPCGSEFEQ